MGRLLAILLLIGWVCTPAQAHLLNMTKVQARVQADGRVDVDLQIDLTRASGGSMEYYRLSRVAEPLKDAEIRALLGRLAAAVILRLDDATVPLQVVDAKLPPASRELYLDPLNWPMTQVRLAGRLPAGHFEAPKLVGLFAPAFRFEEPIAVTLQGVAEQRSMTRWLIAGQQTPPFAIGPQAVAAVTPETTGEGQFLVFGFLHILPKGLDHVLFVLGLFLGARSLKSLVVLVSCFTVAHSITLGMAGLGILQLPPRVIEPLISASIVWIGVENLYGGQRTTRWRPLVVFAFGLLHGLGFASALATLDFTRDNFLLSLLSFNVGIELGQLTVIAVALLLTFAVRQRDWYRPRVTRPASVVIALIALFWTVQRLAGAPS